MTPRLVLVDDHPVVRAGVRALIESRDDLRVVGEAANAADAVRRPPRCARCRLRRPCWC